MSSTTTTRINPESQKMLAKLLAKENITVHVGNYSTAFFDCEKRILGLPTWNTDSKSISDLLVGHEVGHALYTPADGITNFKHTCPEIPFSIVNIVEDIRIERLVQSNYPGLVHSFKDGYRQFIEKDFFKIKKEKIETLNFADRLNLRGKIGNQVKIPLSTKEEIIYSRCLKAETFEEVLDICKDIYAMIKEEVEKQKEEQHAEPDEKSEKISYSKEKSDKDKEEDPTAGNDESDESDEDKKSKEFDKSESDEDGKDSAESDEETSKDGEDESDEDSSASNKAGDGETGNNPDWNPNYSEQDQFKADTLDTLMENLDSLQEVITDYQIGNSPSPKDMMNVIVPVADIMAERKVNKFNYDTIMNSDMVKDDWKKFKDDTKKHLEVLVKEFERKKAAFQYSRSLQTNSGVLDAKRLYSYKFTDQIFKSNTNIADAKNHGMMFFIDYSGSMRYTIKKVINQTLQLVMFCKAVGIPFEVYGFTSSHYKNPCDDSVVLPGNNICMRNTHLIELINSDMKKSDYELAVRELKAQSCAFYTDLHEKSYTHITMPLGGNYEILGMTPLHETIIIAHELVKRFRAKRNIQKMNTLFLSDGDAYPMTVNKNSDSHEKELVVGRYAATPTKMKINGGKDIVIPAGYMANRENLNVLYSQLIENLKTTCDTTVTGFFIGNTANDYRSAAINAMRHSASTGKIGEWDIAAETVKNKMAIAKKERCMIIDNGYHYNAYFVFDASTGLNVSESEGFSSEVTSSDGNFGDTVSQNKLAKDFSKFNKEKKISRVFLDKFIEIIA